MCTNRLDKKRETRYLCFVDNWFKTNLKRGRGSEWESDSVVFEEELTGKVVIRQDSQLDTLLVFQPQFVYNR